jgi:hypothetical protein
VYLCALQTAYSFLKSTIFYPLKNNDLFSFMGSFIYGLKRLILHKEIFKNRSFMGSILAKRSFYFSKSSDFERFPRPRNRSWRKRG